MIEILDAFPVTRDMPLTPIGLHRVIRGGHAGMSPSSRVFPGTDLHVFRDPGVTQPMDRRGLQLQGIGLLAIGLHAAIGGIETGLHEASDVAGAGDHALAPARGNEWGLLGRGGQRSIYACVE